MSDVDTEQPAGNEQAQTHDETNGQVPQPGGTTNGHERMVHRGWDPNTGGKTDTGYRSTPSNIEQYGISQFPTNTAGADGTQRPQTNAILQTSLANQPGTSTGTTTTTTARSNTPITTATQNRDLDSIINQLERISITDQQQMTIIRPPDYLTNKEQIQRIHHLELVEQKKHADTSKTLYNVVSFLQDQHPAGEGLNALKDQLQLEAVTAEQKAYDKLSSIQKANKVVKYYKTPLQKPQLTEAPADFRKTFHRTSPREITGVTGLFDPADNKADFNHVWSKLIGYGQANYFTEQEYKDALRYILQGDAYESFQNFEQTNQSFDYILEYFGNVYARKRTLEADRQAVDKFKRFKDEPLEHCMHRSQVAIDRLKHLYREEAWPEIRIQMRKNILTQVVAEETRRYIQLEEDETLEQTGMPYDLKTLISIASRFEKVHDKIPKKDLQTIFRVASGGLLNEVENPRSSQKHKNKDITNDKELIREVVSEFLINPVMTKKVSSNDARETRRSNYENERHQKRRDVYNENRKMDVDIEPTHPSSSSSNNKLQEKLRFAMPIEQARTRSPSPGLFQPRSYEENKKPERGRTDYRKPDNTSPPYKNQNMDGRNKLYRSQERYKDYRSLSRDRNNNKPNTETALTPWRPNQPKTDQDRQSSLNRERMSQYSIQNSNRNRDYSQERRNYDENRQRDYSRERRQFEDKRQRDYSRERRQYEERRQRDYSQDRRSRYDQRSQSYDQNNNNRYRQRSNSRDRNSFINKNNDYRRNRSDSRGRSPSRERRDYYLRNTSPGGTRIIIDVNGVKYKKLDRQSSEN